MLRSRIRSACGFLVARQAGLLLAVLLSHFALMVSPLHAGVVHSEEQSPAHLGQVAHPDHCPTCGPVETSINRQDGSGDCAFESGPPPEAITSLRAGSQAFGWLGSAAGQLGSPSLLSLVLDPPGLGPAQALLQVFRN
jgi:hypothetical protein